MRVSHKLRATQIRRTHDDEEMLRLLQQTAPSDVLEGAENPGEAVDLAAFARLVAADQTKATAKDDDNELRQIRGGKETRDVGNSTPSESAVMPSYEFSSSQSNARFVYEFMFVIVIIWSLLEIPFRVAFEPVLPVGYWVIVVLIDATFVLDVVLRFFLPFQKRVGYFITDHAIIRQNYLRSWFFFDLLSSIPWDLIVLIIWLSNYELAAVVVPGGFRWVRLTRFTRVFHVSKRLKEWEIHLDVNSTIFRLIRLLFEALVCLHIFGCFFYVTAQAPGFANSWAEKDNLVGADTFSKYIRSLYWSVTTWTTVGYGDITPQNNGEMIYTMITMIFAVFFLSYITGNVVSWLSASEDERNELSDQLSYYKRYMRYRHVPPDLSKKVLKYFRLQDTKFHKYDDKEVLMSLTPGLRREMCWHLSNSLLGEWDLLQDKSPSFITAVVLRLKRETRSPLEKICTQGTKANKFYILTSGMAAVIKDGEWKASLMSGAQFGEGALFSTEGIRKSTVMAQTPCELLSLKKKDIADLLVMFPAYKESFEEYAASKLFSYDDPEYASKMAVEQSERSRYFGRKSNNKGKKKYQFVADDVLVAKARESFGNEEFLGQDLVSYLVEQYDELSTRSEAIGVCVRLWRHGWLENINCGVATMKKFKDSLETYRWTQKGINFVPAPPPTLFGRFFHKSREQPIGPVPYQARPFVEPEDDTAAVEMYRATRAARSVVEQVSKTTELTQVLNTHIQRLSFRDWLRQRDAEQSLLFYERVSHYALGFSLAAKVNIVNNLLTKFVLAGAKYRVKFDGASQKEIIDAVREKPAVKVERLDTAVEWLSTQAVAILEELLRVWKQPSEPLEEEDDEDEEDEEDEEENRSDEDKEGDVEIEVAEIALGGAEQAADIMQAGASQDPMMDRLRANTGVVMLRGSVSNVLI